MRCSARLLPAPGAIDVEGIQRDIAHRPYDYVGREPHAPVDDALLARWASAAAGAVHPSAVRRGNRGWLPPDARWAGAGCDSPRYCEQGCLGHGRPASTSRRPAVTMRLEFSHLTRFTYSSPVTSSHKLLRLTPRAFASQRVLSSGIEVMPAPTSTATRRDAHGNTLTEVFLQKDHRELSIHALAEVDVTPAGNIDANRSPAWDELAARLHTPWDDGAWDAVPFCFRVAPHHARRGPGIRGPGFQARYATAPCSGGSCVEDLFGTRVPGACHGRLHTGRRRTQGRKRRLPGLHSPCHRMPAGVRTARALCQRLPVD